MGVVPLPVGGRDDSVLTPEEGRKATVRTSLEWHACESGGFGHCPEVLSFTPWPWGAVEMARGGAESGALPYSFPLQHSAPLLGTVGSWGTAGSVLSLGFSTSVRVCWKMEFNVALCAQGCFLLGRSRHHRYHSHRRMPTTALCRHLIVGG